MVVDFIVKYQAHLYILLTVALAVGLYWYIYHLYSSQKSGKKDYEKYSNIALHDEIDDTPVEAMPKDKNKSDNEEEQK